MEGILLFITYIFLIAAVLLGLFSLWRLNKLLSRSSYILLLLAFVAITAALIMRSVAAGRPPFANLYEFSLLFAWGILLSYFISIRFIKSEMVSIIIALLATFILSFSRSLISDPRPLLPALQSIWLQIHVFTAVIAYGAFALSFCLGIIYILKEKGFTGMGETALPPAKIDNLLYRVVAIGFFFMTLVLITGAVWAEEVWGRWWGWDPKETWALITWLIYAAYLHARKTYGWRGRRAAIMAVVGFLAVLFTLFGVSLLLPGVHSYV